MASNFMSVEYSQPAMSRFKNRFAERKKIAVMNRIKTTEGAGALLLLQAIEENIDRQGLVDTGAYRASWGIQIGSGYAKVFTKHPAARRLEYGFAGVDSLGRLYNQPARPHVRPAIADTKEKIVESIRRGIIEEIEND